MIDLAFCVKCRNEGPYILEWIAWHWYQGARKFFILDDNTNPESEVDFRLILDPLIKKGIVEYKLNGILGDSDFYEQAQWFDYCAKKEKDNVKFMAFFDIDEFYYNYENQLLIDFINSLDNPSGIEFNWFYMNGKENCDKKSDFVTQRFIKRIKEHNEHKVTKSIVKCAEFDRIHGLHMHNFFYKEPARIFRNDKSLLEEKWNQNLHARFIELPHIPGPAIIVHYFLKSKAEWEIKTKYKRSGGGGKNSKTMEKFDYINSLEDLDFIGLHKEYLNIKNTLEELLK